MKASLIVVFVLNIVTASHPAFGTVRGKLSENEPRPVAKVSVPANGESVVVVAMPFSSLQLNPPLVDYLELTPTQVKSVQALMDQERPKTEALTLRLKTVSTELVMIRQSQNNNRGAAQSLAVTQTRILKQLVAANSRLQRRINDVLDQQQRKKLDSFNRANDVTVMGGD